MSDLDVVKNELKHVKEKLDSIDHKLDEHLKVCTKARMDVHDNSHFRTSMSKHLWFIYTLTVTSIVGWFIKK